MSGTTLQGPCIHLPKSTATPTPMADESMADEFKVNTIQWRIANCIRILYISYEILKMPEKKKHV